MGCPTGSGVVFSGSRDFPDLSRQPGSQDKAGLSASWGHSFLGQSQCYGERWLMQKLDNVVRSYLQLSGSRQSSEWILESKNRFPLHVTDQFADASSLGTDRRWSVDRGFDGFTHEVHVVRLLTPCSTAAAGVVVNSPQGAAEKGKCSRLPEGSSLHVATEWDDVVY